MGLEIWKGSPAESRRRMGLGQSLRGADAPEAAWAGVQAPAQMFWASLNSLCRKAHPDTSFCRAGRKGNDGGRVEKDRRPHTNQN